MHQAIHIFRKDVRRLRYEIAVLLLLNAAFTWLAARAEELTLPVALVQGLLPVCWAYVAALLVFGEPLAGTRQFWTTRPYRLPSLLAAKAMFIVAFVFVPLLLQDSLILAAQGFSPWLFARDIFVHVLGLAAVWTIPVMAVAAVTTGVAQCIFAIVALCVEMVVVSMFFAPAYAVAHAPFDMRMQWIFTLFLVTAILITALVTLAITYRWRWILPARVLLVACVICLVQMRQLIPARWQMEIQHAASPVRDVPELQFRLPNSHVPFKDHADQRGGRGLYVWADYDERPNQLVWQDLATATVTMADGRRYELTGVIGAGRHLGGYLPVRDQSIHLEGPATIDLRVLVTITESQQPVPDTGDEYITPDFRCRVDERSLDTHGIRCRAPFKPPRIGELHERSGGPLTESYAPVPMSFDPLPIAWREGVFIGGTYYVHGATVRAPRPASVTRSRIVAHVIREIRGAHIIIEPMPTATRETPR